jgi:hypothetical protein
MLVLGRAYAPPSIYSSLEIEINPDPGLLVVSGIAGSFIQIRQPIPQPPTVQTVSGLRLEVKENKTTVCVVTLDLDSTLVRRTEWFEYHPTLYVSSIQIY